LGTKTRILQKFFQIVTNFCTSKEPNRKKDLGEEKGERKRIEEDNVGHNSSGVGRVATTSLEDESNHSCNFNNREVG
jgi:hypothetical protein